MPLDADDAQVPADDDDLFGSSTDDDEDPPNFGPDGKLTPAARSLFEEQKAVVFVDLLGFAQLTLKWPVVEDDFRLLDRPNREDFLRIRLDAAGNNRLIETYMHFNMAIDAAIEHGLLQEMRIEAITFSDSAFIATDRVYNAMDVAEEIWQRLTTEHIPVRIGIAYGSFLVMRFRTDTSLRARTHTAQFAGKGVVWAHAACERSGLKGFRIFLHPSASDEIGGPRVGGDLFAPQLRSSLELGENERSDHVACEVMLLHHTVSKLKDMVDREWWRRIQQMRQVAVDDEALPGALAHYDATFDALNRMRQNFGRGPLHPLEEYPLEPRPQLFNLPTKDEAPAARLKKNDVTT